MGRIRCKGIQVKTRGSCTRIWKILACFLPDPKAKIGLILDPYPSHLCLTTGTPKNQAGGLALDNKKPLEVIMDQPLLNST